MDRRLFIVIAVVGFHALGLWALQTGLLRRAVELVVPVEVLAELIELPQPQVTPAPPPPQQPAKPVQKQLTPHKQEPKPAPQPMAIADPTPSAASPTGTTAPQPLAPSPPTPAPVVVAAPAPLAPPKIVLPSSEEAFLNNPRPPYPTLSARLGETGTVVLRVFVEVNGRPSQVLLSKSSGYNRLDQAALITVKNRYRFVPGTRDGIPIPSWVVFSLTFELTE